jgi:hypothetical protein
MIFSHPTNVCMSYIQHCYFALKLSCYFLIGAISSFIHAFIPDIFVNTPSNVNDKITFLIKTSGCR